MSQGKATVSFSEPPHDIYISKVSFSKVTTPVGDNMCMFTRRYTQKPQKKMKVTDSNHQADSPFCADAFA